MLYSTRQILKAVGEVKEKVYCTRETEMGKLNAQDANSEAQRQCMSQLMETRWKGSSILRHLRVACPPLLFCSWDSVYYGRRIGVAWETTCSSERKKRVGLLNPWEENRETK
jgi:hypothetical protein